MRGNLSTFWVWMKLQICALLSVVCAGAFLCSYSFAESYSERPDILSLTPTKHAELGATWEKLKAAHLEAIAMLSEMYPDQEIYFLARDSEYLYDMMKIMAQDDPALLKRVHLLNISRANMRKPNVLNYLSQEGINVELLQSGKKVLFVDTGFSGTISKTISEYYPAELAMQMQTHLMSSSNPMHPSSRVFLTHLNPAAPNVSPGSMHATVLSYEEMARFTERSSHFEKANDGKWDAVSDPGKFSDGKVSRDDARRYMEDLADYSNHSKKLFKERREKWKNLYKLDQNGNRDELKAALQVLVDSREPLDLAMARDFLEMQRTNLSSQEKINFEDLGLEEIVDKTGFSNKLELMKKHPEWKKVLEEPVTEISKLIEDKEFLKLGAIADVIKDEEFEQILCAQLGAHADMPGVKKLVSSLILKTDDLFLEKLAANTFSNPLSSIYLNDLLKKFIEKENPKVLKSLARNFFTRIHNREMDELLKLVIEKGDNDVLVTLAVYTFQKPYMGTKESLIKMVIEKGDNRVLAALAECTFSRRHTAGMEDLLEMMIRKGNSAVRAKIAEYAIAHRDKTAMSHLIKLLIDKGDNYVLRTLALHTFPAIKMNDEIMKNIFSQVIDKGDNSVLALLAHFTFPNQNLPEMHDLIKRAMQKGNNNVLSLFLEYVFSKPEAVDLFDLLPMVVERGNNKLFQSLITNVLPKIHGQRRIELINQIEKKADKGTLDFLNKFKVTDCESVEKILSHEIANSRGK